MLISIILCIRFPAIKTPFENSICAYHKLIDNYKYYHPKLSEHYFL